MKNKLRIVCAAFLGLVTLFVIVVSSSKIFGYSLVGSDKVLEAQKYELITQAALSTNCNHHYSLYFVATTTVLGSCDDQGLVTFMEQQGFMKPAATSTGK